MGDWDEEGKICLCLDGLLIMHMIFAARYKPSAQGTLKPKDRDINKITIISGVGIKSDNS